MASSQNFKLEQQLETFTVRSILPQLLALVFGAFMVLLDSTVINVAIPKLVNYFQTNLKMVQWTVTSYTLALSAVIPMAGWLSDRFGFKRIFTTTVALFTIGSALCALAQTTEQLILFRVIQGLGGGMVMPLVMSMGFKLAPANKRGTVMAVLGIPLMLGPALGPVVSGWLIEYASWHWIFLLNLPIGVLAIFFSLRFFPASEHGKPPHFDYLGIILAPIAFSMLVYGVSEGGTSWTSTGAIVGLGIGGTALILFIIVELMQKRPLLELRAFRSSDFTRGILLSWIFFVVNYGAVIMLPLYLQNVQGLTPLHTGLLQMPMALIVGIAMPIAGKLFDKIGARPLAMAGMTFYAAGLFILSGIHSDSSLGLVYAPLILMGLGAGFTLMPLNTHVLNSAPPHLMNRVTPLASSAQQIVISFAVTSLVGYMTSQTTDHMLNLGQAGHANPLTAMADAFGDTFFLIAWFAVTGAMLSLILRKPKKSHGTGERASDSSTVIGQ